MAGMMATAKAFVMLDVRPVIVRDVGIWNPRMVGMLQFTGCPLNVGGVRTGRPPATYS